MAFTQLQFDRIRYLIEPKQVGSAGSAGLSLHTEKPPNAATQQLLGALRNTGVATVPVAERTPGVPPSSSHAFLLENPDLAAVVIADHADQYANAFYDSDWDQLSNVQAQLVCDAAQMIARCAELRSPRPPESSSAAAACYSWRATVSRRWRSIAS